MDQCEKVGSIGLLIAYPADVKTKIPMVTNNTHGLRNTKPIFYPQQTEQQQHKQPTEKKQQLIGIIDKSNAPLVFQNNHLKFLNVLKNTMKECKIDELKGKGNRLRKRKKSKKSH